MKITTWLLSKRHKSVEQVHYTDSNLVIVCPYLSRNNSDENVNQNVSFFLKKIVF